MSSESEVINNKDIIVEVEPKLLELVEPVFVDTKQLESKSIVLLLLQVLSSDEKITNLKIELNDDTTSVLYKLIYFSPDFLNEIDKLVNEIIKDNKIDSNDIPNLILLIKKLYELIHRLKEINFDDAKKVEICSTILKFLVRFLVEERKVNINNENKELVLELIDTLIDSCISLIHFSGNIKINSCFTHIKSLFGCK
jgi:hypothetical protein